VAEGPETGFTRKRKRNGAWGRRAGCSTERPKIIVMKWVDIKLVSGRGLE